MSGPAFLPTCCICHRSRDRTSDPRQAARAALARVGLADRCQTGRQARSPTARSSASKSPARWQLSRSLLLLDEPAAGCNPVETQEIDAVIRSIVKDGITVVLVEHDMRLVMNISDRIHVLAQRPDARRRYS